MTPHLLCMYSLLKTILDVLLCFIKCLQISQCIINDITKGMNNIENGSMTTLINAKLNKMITGKIIRGIARFCRAR